MALTAKPIQVRPTSTKTVLKTNYISLFDYSSQEQSVSGMLYMLGAEAGFASDKVIWTEEGRLHTVYNDVTRSGNVFTKAGHVFRKNETVHLSDGSTKRRGIIIAVDDAAGTFEVAPYKSAGFTALGTTAVTAFVDGSEHQKGTKGAEGSLQTDFSIHDNKPIILKDKFEVNGSDATQVGWVMVLRV